MVTDGKFVGEDIQDIVGLDLVSRLTNDQQLLITVFHCHREMYDVVQKWRMLGGENLEMHAKVYLHMAKKIGMPDLFDERVVSEVIENGK